MLTLPSKKKHMPDVDSRNVEKKVPIDVVRLAAAFIAKCLFAHA